MVRRWRRKQSAPVACQVARPATRAMASWVLVASVAWGATMWSSPAHAIALTAVTGSGSQREVFCGAVRDLRQLDTELTNAAKRIRDWQELRSLTVELLRESRDNYAVMAAHSKGRLRDDLRAVIEYARRLEADVAGSHSREEFARALR